MEVVGKWYSTVIIVRSGPLVHALKALQRRGVTSYYLQRRGPQRSPLSDLNKELPTLERLHCLICVKAFALEEGASEEWEVRGRKCEKCEVVVGNGFN